MGADIALLVIGVTPLGMIYGLLRLYQHWLSLPRAGDIPQIKAQLEANEHRVVDLQPAGFERGSLGRYESHQSYRKYRVTVSSPIGGPNEVQLVGVQAGLLAFRSLKFYEPRRHHDFAPQRLERNRRHRLSAPCGHSEGPPRDSPDNLAERSSALSYDRVAP